ncbi:hypothetical protein Pcinc_004707 [Petrolisthes cinctipes]|uniref:Cuticle protein n=1 Tax=Petrolisthes cinctipes TaxID=88211 RepID=A0AAE1GKW2_PETCI|nr:hypothetical protein Pcinc_004707 [Petrolisthes cinctipes]
MLHKVVLVALVASVVADKRPRYEPDPYDPDSYEPDRYDPDPYDHSNEYDHSHEDYPKYHFDWKVKDHYNDFGHKEYRDGYDTEGEYYVLLPDGRRQTVTYYVKKGSGFVADVKYDPEDPIYPSSGEYKKYKPTYDRDEYEPPYDN